MTLKPNFSLIENWEYIGEVTGYQTQDPEGKVIDIGKLVFPFTLHKSTLAITSRLFPSPPDTWDYAGKAVLQIRTGILVGGSLDSNIGTRKLWLNQVNLLIFPNLATDYKLVIYVPKWFRQVTYSVLSYIGEGIPDIESKLNTIGETL